MLPSRTGASSIHRFHLRVRIPSRASGGSRELCIAGPGLALGYVARDDLTREKFFEHATLGRLYRSGDLARLSDAGEIEFDENALRSGPVDRMSGGHFALTWQLAENRSLYAAMTRGYKAGGFNLDRSGFFGAENRPAYAIAGDQLTLVEDVSKVKIGRAHV